MKPARPRYSRINAKVEELLTAANVSEAPVPVEEISGRVGARVVRNHFNGEISGVLVRKNGDIVIGVEDNQSPQRQRFTIAHEIGHLLLHEGQEVRVDKDFRVNLRSSVSSTAEDVEEIEANTFAASLLMPYRFLIRDLQNEAIDLDNENQIFELAQRYEVSAQAMTYRIMNISRNR